MTHSTSIQYFIKFYVKHYGVDNRISILQEYVSSDINEIIKFRDNTSFREKLFKNYLGYIENIEPVIYQRTIIDEIYG